MCKMINFPNKGDFSSVSGEQRENLLMETAMRIQEVFDDMFYANLIDVDKVCGGDSLERLQLFRSWAREFENTYHGTEKYEDDFIGLSEDYAIDKVKSEFGND